MQKKLSFQVSSPEEDEFSIALKDANSLEVLPIIGIIIDVEIKESFAHITAHYQFLNFQEAESSIFLEIVRPKNILLDSVSIITESDKKVHKEKDLHTSEMINTNNNNTIVFNQKLKLNPSEKPEVVFACIAKINVENDNENDFILAYSLFEHIFTEKERQIYLKTKCIHHKEDEDAHAHTSAPYEINITICHGNGVQNVRSKSGHVIYSTYNEDKTVSNVKHSCGDPRGNSKDLIISYELITKTTMRISFMEDKNDTYYMYMIYNPEHAFIKLNMDEITQVPKWIEYEAPVIYYYAIDRSQKMIGDYFDAVVDSFDVFLASIPSQCMFNVISIGDNTTLMFDDCLQSTEENRKLAIKNMSELTPNMTVCSMVKFMSFYKKEIICNVDNEYAYNPQRVFILTNCLDSVTEFHFNEQFQDGDVQFFYFSLGCNVSVQVEDSIARLTNGKVIVINNLTDIPSLLNYYIGKTLNPYLYSFSSTVSDPMKTDFIQNSICNTYFTKVKNLRSNIELLTKLKIPSNKIYDKFSLFINFTSIGGNIISEEIPVDIKIQKDLFFDKFYDYHFVQKQPNEKVDHSKLDKYIWHLCAHMYCLSCKDNMYQDIAFDVYVGGKQKLTIISKENAPVKKLIKRVANRLGYVLEHLTITSKGKEMVYDGTLRDHINDIDNRIDVERQVFHKELEIDRQIIGKLGDSMWKYDPELFIKMGGNEISWKDLKEKNSIATGLSEESLKAFQENQDDILFTIYIINYLKYKFGKRNYDAVFIKAEKAMKDIMPDYNESMLAKVNVL